MYKFEKVVKAYFKSGIYFLLMLNDFHSHFLSLQLSSLYLLVYEIIFLALYL